MAKEKLAERQAFLSVVRHRSDIPTSDIEHIMSQMDKVYKMINDNQLLGKFDKYEERTHISNLNEMCQEAPMEEEITTAIFIAFAKDGQRQVIMDSEASQAARCWNKFRTHCLTNHPMSKQSSIALESVPLIAEILFKELQILLDFLVKLLFYVNLSSPGKTAEYSKFLVVQQAYKYNTLPTHNTQRYIMAEEQPIVLLTDTFLVQAYAQIVRGNYPQFQFYGLDALGLGLNIKLTTFNKQLKNQKKAKLNALKCSCETKQGVALSFAFS
jgi:hypothetical protein